MKRTAIAIILASFALTACETPEPEEDHVLKDYEKAMEKAEGVEDDVLKAAEEQRRRIEEQEGGG